MRERVVVSGGSGGIGAALCRILADKGLEPVVGYASGRQRAEALAREIGGAALALDLMRPEAIDAAVDALAEGPPIAGVVLAAAPAPSLARFGRIDEAEMERSWRIQVLGPQRLLAGAIKRWLRPRKRGVVLGVLSAAMGAGDGSGAMASMGGYVIGKYGMQGVLAACAADHPWLAVRSLSPGFTRTAMLETFDARFVAKLDEAGRVGEPEAVAQDIADVFLDALPERGEPPR